MTVTHVTIKEINGAAPTAHFLADDNSIQVCSHKDCRLVVLRFMKQTIAVEASALQYAIQGAVISSEFEKASVESTRSVAGKS